MSSTIYTIGHGRQQIDNLIGLLKASNIEVLADVRAVPRSRWPQFNQKALIAALGQATIQYSHFPELGWKIPAPPADFYQGIVELIKLSQGQRVCMMCAESLPEKCHRTLLIAPALQAQKVEVIHIYPNGLLKPYN